MGNGNERFFLPFSRIFSFSLLALMFRSMAYTKLLKISRKTSSQVQCEAERNELKRTQLGSLLPTPFGLVIANLS